ncbi:Rpn family recombination-promoting nuclease/putative transposase [Cardinium endosymbiont of Dermatophagoides farinae]|uniref:Rpn family recombination-promoting nuclease/putative transposase n=1 Tax=Cardinium endosymbiont of Dermatophagoides farinae TaxID=2597823 RepID=UPI001181F1D8|nr:Rpn family recombination-promoting nuclease/putative transposase [Cardinium endosymbiont of Dermatophagoides farinae]
MQKVYYQLVDLYAMPDDEIKKKAHLGMMEYFMKYVHVRDMIKVMGGSFRKL